MESNAKRIEEALTRLHEAADKALPCFPTDDGYQGPLQVIARLTPDAIGTEMVRYAHAQLADGLAEIISTCGYADPELVAVVNGVKELVEKIDGRYVYQDSRWEPCPPQRLEVAK